ncbi:MAG: pyrroline-5-carboxylate reductase, partial [Pseudomonadota bacterium]
MTKPLRMIQIGAGSMGGALLRSWIDAGILDQDASAIVDPRPSPETETMIRSAGLHLNPTDDAGYDVCVLAIKPQQIPMVVPGLVWPGIEATLFLSIAAGVTADETANLLKSNNPSPRVLRAMPSLPAQIRRGVNLLADHDGLTPEDREIGAKLMAAAGAVHWCKDEDQLDGLMGVTACGPAFVFRVVEALEEAARAQGADPEAARVLAAETVVAASRLLEADGRDAGALRAAVTSPGGTTAAGLEVLNARGLVANFVDAVDAAYRR